MLRFAISPTKAMSLNKLRLAIFNHILSKQKNEQLLVRIDDTNKEKNIEGNDKEILEILSLFSIDYSHAVYQSENLKYHQKLVMQLMNQKKAFACFCGEEKLKELEKYDNFCETLSDETVMSCTAPFSVRIKAPENCKFDSFVLLRHDKTAAYNYACAVDDMLYDISTIIRDEDKKINTEKQSFVRETLNYDKKINYVYLPKIESLENVTVKSLIDDGFLPSAIANYLVLLGTKANEEIFSLEDAISWFDIEKLSNDIEFDLNKLQEINKKHLEQIDDLRLSKLLGFADADIGQLAKLFLDEANTLKQLKEKIDLIFSTKSTCIDYEEEFVELKVLFKDAPFFNTFEEVNTYISSKTNFDEDRLEKALRCLLTGSTQGPDLSKIYSLIKNYIGEIVK